MKFGVIEVKPLDSPERQEGNEVLRVNFLAGRIGVSVTPNSLEKDRMARRGL
jgi:hypothetical protein